MNDIFEKYKNNLLKGRWFFSWFLFVFMEYSVTINMSERENIGAEHFAFYASNN